MDLGRVDTAPMIDKKKRTYNLSAETVARVRSAVERLYQDVRDRKEARLWARASEDPEFRSEMRAISIEYADREPRP